MIKFIEIIGIFLILTQKPTCDSHGKAWEFPGLHCAKMKVVSFGGKG